MMTGQGEVIREYQEWREERLFSAPQPGSVEDYEEHLRVVDLEDRLKLIYVLASEEHPDALKRIAEVAA